MNESERNFFNKPLLQFVSWAFGGKLSLTKHVSVWQTDVGNQQSLAVIHNQISIINWAVW